MRAVRFSLPMFRALRAQAKSSIEEVSFFLARPSEQALVAFDMRTIRPSEFVRQSERTVALADGVRSDLIAWASAANASLIEAHSHVRGDPVCLSPTDIAGLREWVPHLWWRLKGRPYAAIVQAGRTLDGVVYADSPHVPRRIDEIWVDGTMLPTTGLSHEMMRGGHR
jgi:hypothetical protein